MKKPLLVRIDKKKILAMTIVMALISHLMLITSVWAQDAGEEPDIVVGDLEGPDSIPPPKYYRTREMMLAEAGLAGSSPGPPPVTVTGTREILALLVEFSDVAHDPTHTVAYFNDRFFDTAPPSVRDYYDEVSYGSFTYVPGAVMGWYASTFTQAQFVGPPVNHYPVFVGGIGDVDPFFDFGPYDTDNNGVVENEELTVFMIVTGNQGGARHTWNRPNVATVDTNALGNPVSVEGEYSVTHEFRHIGSYAHELGHDLGLPDLYDTDATITGDSEGIGNYGLMGGGSWTFSHMTAWSKIQLGWITPTIVKVSDYYDVHDAETNAEAYVLIDPSYSTDEYFLIENRHPANSYYETIGPPIAPGGTFPDEGIVIYHIDEARIQDWINFGTNNVNVDETHKGIDVETAEHPTSHVIDADDLDAGFNRGDSDDLWDINEYDFHDGSTPCNANWYGNIDSGVDVRNFPVAGPTMRVYFSVPMPEEFVPIDLVLVLDRSGSMGSYMNGKRKIEGAKESAIAVVDTLLPGDRVSVVTFSSYGSTNVQLTTDFDLAKTEIGKISAGGMTSFGAGMSLALNELKSRGSADAVWAIIFMSNGWQNTAPSPNPYVAECKDLGIPIYTVGLGSYPGNVNEPLLKWMASETGGKYLFAPSLYELQNIFLRFSLEVTGWTPVDEFSGIVYEDQTVVAGTFDVAPFTVFTRVTLNWPGSDLDLILLRPDGSEVDLIWGLDNIYSGTTAKPEWVILLAPQAGTWTVEVYGKIINSPDEPFIVWVSAYVPPTPIDMTPPTTSLEIGTPKYVDALGNVYIASSTTLTLDAIDNSDTGSGVALTGYRYAGGWIEGVPPISFYIEGPDGTYYIEYNSTDNAGNVESTNTETTILDNTSPLITVSNPPAGWALQDGVTFMGSIVDSGSGVFSVSFSFREANDGEGIPIGFEDLPVPYDPSTGEWSFSLDTLLVPDGYYLLYIEAEDNLGNRASTKVPYSIRNWAVLELLPASEKNKARRTMPVKFALRVAAVVDPLQPFVYNEELTIDIYATDKPDEILQESTFGDHARDYRINSLEELYITNFKTLRTPKEYLTEVYRKGMLIGSFTFETVK